MKIGLSLTTVCAVVAVFTTPLLAQEPDLKAKARFFVEPCAKAKIVLGNLGLSDEQKMQVADILYGYQQSLEESKGDLVAAQNELFQVIHWSDIYNEDTIRGVYKNYSAVLEERVVVDAEVTNQMKTTLTSAQYAKFVKGKVALYECSRAPKKVFTTIFSEFVNNNRTK